MTKPSGRNSNIRQSKEYIRKRKERGLLIYNKPVPIGFKKENEFFAWDEESVLI